jgi:hypothetical protein
VKWLAVQYANEYDGFYRYPAVFESAVFASLGRVAARIPRGPMTLSPGVSHPSLSPAGVIGPPVCREHGTGSCPMAGRVVMARPSRSAWSPIHSPSERIHLMNRRDVSACWRSNSKQVAKIQNTDQHELSASNAESKHIGAQTTKEHAVLYGPR